MFHMPFLSFSFELSELNVCSLPLNVDDKTSTVLSECLRCVVQASVSPSCWLTSTELSRSHCAEAAAVECLLATAKGCESISTTKMTT